MNKGDLLTFVKAKASYLFPTDNCPLKTDSITWTTHAKFGLVMPQITNITLAMLHEGALTATRKIAQVVERCEEFGSEKVLVLPGENPTADIAANVKSRLIPNAMSLKAGLKLTTSYTQSVAPVAAVKTINVESLTGLAGKKLRVGSKTYAFVAASPSGDQILIGADAAETETNIKDKILADSLYTRCTAAIVSNKVQCTATIAGTDFPLDSDAPALLTIATTTANTEEEGETVILEEYDPAYVPPALGMACVGVDQNGKNMLAVFPKVDIPGDLADEWKFGAVVKGNLTFEASLEATRSDGVRVNYFKRTYAPFNTAIL